jgi:DNA-binding CsgD family transcriptional regulator
MECQVLNSNESLALGLISRGCGITETADSLCVSPRTIVNLLMAARLKLGARTTAHAVRIAVERGLI